VSWEAAVTRILGRQVTDLCAALIAAEAACRPSWAKLADGRGRLAPATLAASQAPVSDAAEALRAACEEAPAEAEAARQALLRAQAEGDTRTDKAIRAQRGKPARDEIRMAWNSERYSIFTARDALTVGLGWPHRGEPVTATGAPCYPAPGKYQFTGPGIYFGSASTHNTGHSVWFAEDGRLGRRLLVMWEPQLARHGSADPAGDIRMRVAARPGRRLPVPLLRWPAPEDIEGGAELAAAAAPPARTARKPAGRSALLELDLFGDGLL
jgi:hypothetical protein